MALTPAEKQRRYRERLRERLSAADNALHSDDVAVLRAEWHAKQLELEGEIAELERELAIALGQRKR